MTLTRCETRPGRDGPPLTVSVQVLLDTAHEHLARDNARAAHAALTQARDILQRRLDLEDHPVAEVHELFPSAWSMSARHDVALLTKAERRLLPYLGTHLNFREIGERLYISKHTTKSQAISIYRKLGVSSRSQAISRMHELGLVEPRERGTA